VYIYIYIYIYIKENTPKDLANNQSNIQKKRARLKILNPKEFIAKKENCLNLQKRDDRFI